MIWDVHAHLHGVDGRTPEERMANLVRFTDRMGVERVCVSMGFPFVMDPTPDQLRRQNDQVLQAIAHHHDRAFGFVYVSGKHPTRASARSTGASRTARWSASSCGSRAAASDRRARPDRRPRPPS